MHHPATLQQGHPLCQPRPRQEQRLLQRPPALSPTPPLQQQPLRLPSPLPTQQCLVPPPQQQLQLQQLVIRDSAAAMHCASCATTVDGGLSEMELLEFLGEGLGPITPSATPSRNSGGGQCLPTTPGRVLATTYNNVPAAAPSQRRRQQQQQCVLPLAAAACCLQLPRMLGTSPKQALPAGEPAAAAGRQHPGGSSAGSGLPSLPSFCTLPSLPFTTILSALPSALPSTVLLPPNSVAQPLQEPVAAPLPDWMWQGAQPLPQVAGPPARLAAAAAAEQAQQPWSSGALSSLAQHGQALNVNLEATLSLGLASPKGQPVHEAAVSGLEEPGGWLSFASTASVHQVCCLCGGPVCWCALFRVGA